MRALPDPSAVWHLRQAKLQQKRDAAVRAVATAQAEVELTCQRVIYQPGDVIAQLKAQGSEVAWLI